MADDWWSNDQKVDTTKSNFWDNDKTVDHTTDAGVLSKVGGALQYGTSQLAAGDAKTTGSSLLDTAAKATAPTDYTPASVGLHDSSKSLMDRAGYIPRALLESLPSTVQDLSAGSVGSALGGAAGALVGPEGIPVGAMLGGAAGAGLSGLAREYGNNVQTAASGQTPSTWDKVRSGASAAASGLLSRLGILKGIGTPVTEVGAAAIPQIAGQVVKSGANAAATNVANDVQHQALVQGQVPSANDLGVDAATGAATGAGAHLLATTPKDVTQAIKFKDVDPQFGARVADRFDGLDTSTPKASFAAVEKVQDGLNNEISNYSSDVAPHIKALEDNSGFQDDTKLTLDNIKTQISKGEPVDQGTLDDLRSRFGGMREGEDLVNSLEDANSLNKIKQFGAYDPGTKSFGGGISNTPFAKQFLSPFNNPRHEIGQAAGIGALSHYLFGLEPATATAIGLGVPAAQYGIRGATRGVDSLLGNLNPLSEFTQRFGGANDQSANGMSAPDTSVLPSFRAKVAAQKIADAQAAQTEKAGQQAETSVGDAAVKSVLATAKQRQADADQTDNVMSALDRNIGKAAQSNVDDFYAQHAKDTKYIAGLMSRSQDGPTSDATMAIRHAKFMQASDAQAQKAQTTQDATAAKEEARAQAQHARDTRYLMGLHQNEQARLAKAASVSPDGLTSSTKFALAHAKLLAKYAKEEGDAEGEATPKAAKTAGPKAAGGNTESSEPTISTTVGDHTVTRPLAGILKTARYMAKVNANMSVRKDHIEKAYAAMDGEVHPALNQLHSDLDHNAMTRTSAAKAIKEAVAKVPPEHQAEVGRILSDPQLLATFKD